MPFTHTVKIGPREFDTNIFLAPLSGCADLAFRLIAREHGARICFFEMIDAHSVIHGPSRGTKAILKTHEADRPIAAQILGEDPDIMLRAAGEVMRRSDIAFLDINAACPAKKVIKKKAGAYLLREPKRLFAAIKRLASELPVPVTVKLRLAYAETRCADTEIIARGCEDSGASAIFVHGRTGPQGYSGEIDYGSIRKIKESVNIPVFGSGNIFTPESARMMFESTGCDGILVARGALGNPWIFASLEAYFSPGGIPQVAPRPARKKILKRHLGYIEEHKECSRSGKIGFMRKVMLWYIRGIPEARRIREKVSLVNTYDKMIELIDLIGE